jgi:tetratricopeptide (TPR) repeat protein
MEKNSILLVIIALLVGFIAGFMLANSLNRGAMIVPQPTNSTNASTETGPGSSASELSPEEIRERIAEADRNPDRFSFQKDLGIALYRYGAMKQDVSIIAEAVRLLERAQKLEPNDFDVVVNLGNGQFDIGYYRKENAAFEQARSTYSKALKLKPADADVQTDLGLTYYLQDPPDYRRAIVELEKARQMRPTHERSLHFIIQSYLKLNDLQRAEENLEKLRSLNPSSPAIPELNKMINDARSGAGQ